MSIAQGEKTDIGLALSTVVVAFMGIYYVNKQDTKKWLAEPKEAKA